jgi:hypothetical protein
MLAKIFNFICHITILFAPYSSHMKTIILTLFISLLIYKITFGQQNQTNFITADIDNFWQAYDKIQTTKDSVQQYNYINQLFINKGTPGLKAIMKVRDYTAKSYVDAINSYPLFWNSIRPNTYKAKQFAADIATNVLKLKKLYPALKPAKIYFTMGAFRTGGTTLDSMVLIGSEIAMADEHTNTQEFPANFNSLKTYFKTNPINIVVFNNVHEYVHTQQKTTAADYLVSQCVLEGVAEFMAVKATGVPSVLPAMAYGNSHKDKIAAVFASQMFNGDTGFWLYSNAQNEFGVRDLGYYVGYAICQNYYDKATDKKQAVKDMIELDYNNLDALAAFVDKSGYFNKPVQAIKTDYEKSQPVVTEVKPISNNTVSVNPATTQLTITFSAAMDKHFRNFELGPLGKENLLKLKRFIGFSEDGRSITFEIELKPGQHYQIVVGGGFRNTDGIGLKPYLIDFTTAEK